MEKESGTREDMSIRLSREERAKKNYELRDLFWKNVGKVDSDVLSFLVNPAFMGQPKWPDLRQAYKRIVTEDSVIIATDGLSDEFSDSDSPNQGLGIELYVEIKDSALMDLSFQELGSTWAFQILYQAALNAVNSNAYRETAEAYDVFSTEYYDVEVPDECLEEYIGEEGGVGAILGVKSIKVPLKLKLLSSEILILSITLLRVDELEYIYNEGAKGRKEIVEKLKEKGINSICSTNREGVISSC